MEKVGGDFQNFYQREEPHPPGLPLATHTDLAKVNDDIPLEAEVEAAVSRLRPHKAGRHTHLCAEHFKQWRREAYLGGQSKTPPQGELWMCLVEILQRIWRTGEIPQELGWTILILIPKETTDTWGVGLLYTLWKVEEALIDTRLQTSLQMHDVLYGFRTRRGTGVAIIELKLSQELATIDKSPIFLVFLDLRKSYATLDQERLLIIPEGYVTGPCLCGLLQTFWDCPQVVSRQNGFHGPAFPTTRGTTQGGLFSLTLFNVVVDNVIRTWMSMTVEDQRVAHDRLVETVGRCLGVYYADYGMVASREPDYLQKFMNFRIGLFQKYGLAANVAKSRTMT